MYKLLNDILKEKQKEQDDLLLEKELARVKKIKGDKGDKGDKGERGERGESIKGEKGDAGKDGVDGTDGADGQDGIKGDKGEKGDVGDTGSQGEKGAKGERGLQGEKGERGDKGEKGERGFPGIDGIDGIKGDDGNNIQDIKISPDQELLVKLDNGITLNAGKLPKHDTTKDGRRGGGGTTKVYVDAAILEATTDMTVANFASPNVSQWTNDAGYITSAGIPAHNALTGLQGGTTNEYYHLTSAKYTVVQNTSGINTGDQTITLLGDATGSGTGNITVTLATVNTNVGTFGTASSVSTVVLDAKGRATAGSNTAIQIAESQVTSLVSDLAAKQSTTLTNTHILVGNSSNVATDVAMSGDATLANTGAITLKTVNANPGSYGGATVSTSHIINAKGLITAASDITITPAVGSITGLGTGVATALAINVGSAGAPVTFNGAGGTPSSITLTNADGTAPSLTAGIATLASTVSTATEATDAVCFPTFVNLSGSQSSSLKTNTGLNFNSTTNNLATTTFTGALAGNATSATTATTAATLTTPRTIGGVSFDGSANIVPQTVQTVNEATDTTCFPAFFASSGTGNFQLLNNTNLSFNSNTAALTAKKFVANSAAGVNGLDLAAADNYANLRVIQNTTYATDKDIYIGYNSGATSSLFLYTNNVQVMKLAGGAYITSATQPAFYARRTTTVTDVTGDSTLYTVIFNSEAYDQDANYNNATGVFTAPVAGRYAFQFGVMVTGMGASHTTYYAVLAASNRSPGHAYLNPVNVINSGLLNIGSFAVEVDMDAADTAKVQIRVDGGTKVVDVYGEATIDWTYFSGHLVC